MKNRQKFILGVNKLALGLLKITNEALEKSLTPKPQKKITSKIRSKK